MKQYHEKQCCVEGCNNKALKYRKYCCKHEHQIYRYGRIKERTRFDKNHIEIKGDIAEIDLYDYNSNVIAKTIIDAEDVPKIKDHKISFSKENSKRQGGYAYVNINNKNIPLHRIITDTVDEVDKRHNVIDHINGNKLDNRKCNLRKCTVSENNYNGYRQRNHATGVRRHFQKGKYVSWQAYISIDKKQTNLGYFKTKEEAIAARRAAELRLNPDGLYKATIG